jgi:hypothetical protein
VFEGLFCHIPGTGLIGNIDFDRQCVESFRLQTLRGLLRRCATQIACASARAAASPIPPAAPVTIATLLLEFAISDDSARQFSSRPRLHDCAGRTRSGVHG